VISHVLVAMVHPRPRAEGAIRISLARDTLPEDVDALLAALRTLVPELQGVAGR
jgi:cysteine sulfinate desulfinase/cysteine desulfurase-like protein